MFRPLLEVIALDATDAREAERGGADRVEVVADMGADGITPAAATIEAVRAGTGLPMRVMLRPGAGFEADARTIATCARAAVTARELGADGFVFGFLDADGVLDEDAITELAAAVAPLPWTLHRAVDHAFDTERTWRAVARLRRGTHPFDHVLTAGSARGLERGCVDLCRRAGADPTIARLVLAGGGLREVDVPWLARAGIRSFHVGSRARDAGFASPVNAERVARWRRLIDDSVGHVEATHPRPRTTTGR